MKLVIYRTHALRGGGYRWRLVADNGKVLANGGQGHSRRSDMERAIERALSGGFVGRTRFQRIVEGGLNGVEFQDIPVEDRTR